MLMLPSHDDAPLLPAFEGASIWAQLEKPLPPPRYPLRREGPPPEVRYPLGAPNFARPPDLSTSLGRARFMDGLDTGPLREQEVTT